MAHPNLSYVGCPNSNLICCICRAPFTDPQTSVTCSHTFCEACITRAISHSPLCPVDRSPLSLDDLVSADPIIRNLVEELEVECPHRAEGCQHICQRQLLVPHLQNGCQFTRRTCSEPGCSQEIPTAEHAPECPNRTVECGGCGTSVPYRDLETHQSDCPNQDGACPSCSAPLQRSELPAHRAICPDTVIVCIHAEHGCSWTGPRRILHDTHVPACPYEHLKGFLNANTARIATLIEQNTLLRHKLGVLDTAMQHMKREMRAVQVALGPWYKPDGDNNSGAAADPFRAPAPLALAPPLRAPAPTSTAITDATPITEHLPSLPVSRRRQINSTGAFSYGAPGPADPALPLPHFSPSTSLSPADTDVLAPYFPPEGALHPSAMTLPHNFQHPFYPQQQPPHDPYPHTRQPSSTTSLASTTTSTAATAPTTTTVTGVAPLDLHTTLEGALVGMHESVVALSHSMDALALRNDVALRREAIRVGDELGTLRAGIHGLRMQVHALLMDRNAQAASAAVPRPPGDISISGDDLSGPAFDFRPRDRRSYVPGSTFLTPYPPQHSLHATPSVTKL